MYRDLWQEPHLYFRQNTHFNLELRAHSRVLSGNCSERFDAALRQRAFLQGLSAFIKMKITSENAVGKDAQARPHASLLLACSRPKGKKSHSVNGQNKYVPRSTARVTARSLAPRASLYSRYSGVRRGWAGKCFLEESFLTLFSRAVARCSKRRMSPFTTSS